MEPTLGFEQGELVMPTDELREALLAVPGIASAQVLSTADATPHVRLWLDGTRSGDDVRRAVDDVVSRTGSEHRNGDPSPTEARRTGLGRGLDTLIPVARDQNPPGYLAKADQTDGFAKLVIEESDAGVVIRAEAISGRSATASVRDGPLGFNEAIVTAVSALRSLGPTPRLVGVEERVVSDTTVITVVLELESGRRCAGAAVSQGGEPYTLARAVDVALTYLA